MFAWGSVLVRDVLQNFMTTITFAAPTTAATTTTTTTPTPTPTPTTLAVFFCSYYYGKTGAVERSALVPQGCSFVFLLFKSKARGASEWSLR